jgi:hypothetical protein
MHGVALCGGATATGEEFGSEVQVKKVKEQKKIGTVVEEQTFVVAPLLQVGGVSQTCRKNA